jgi:hypothetical protein
MKLDGWALFRAIGSNSAAFTDALPEVHKAALSIVVKVIKRKKTLEQLRGLHDALGEDQFAVVLEHLADKDLKALIKVFDPHNPLRNSGTGQAVRLQLKSLAAGAALPVAKPAAPVKTARPSAKKSVAGMTDASPWPSSMTTVAPRRKG